MNRKKAFDEGIDTEAAIMWEIPMLAAVRSTNSLGGSPPRVSEKDIRVLSTGGMSSDPQQSRRSKDE